LIHIKLIVVSTASAYFKVSIDLTPVGLLYQEEFKDTKGVIRICKSKNDRQHNSQKKKGRKKKPLEFDIRFTFIFQ
jgi:hypothetical protein